MTHSLFKSLTLLAAATSALAQLPANVTDLKKIDVGDGRAVRYKNPKLCETTEGVNSYSGFVDIAEDKHMFFWFFETRGDKAKDPTTLWLNGGPVSLHALSYQCPADKARVRTRWVDCLMKLGLAKSQKSWTRN